MSTSLGVGFWSVVDSLSSYLSLPLAETPLLGVALDGHLLLEAILVVIIVGLMLQKSYKPGSKEELSEKEIEQLCREWEPEPLHPPILRAAVEAAPPILESAAGPRTLIAGRSVLNLGSMNFLGLIGNERLKDASVAAVQKYGVGSCGPRGFYGTIDVHMDLEERVAKFLEVDDCILYSYGLATASSTIPAFCKRGDLIIADEGVGWAIQNGITLSRSDVRFFRHNDMDHLESILREVKEEDRKLRRKVLNRRFIMVEAIYQSSGRMVHLPTILRLKRDYCFRILLDETVSFGVLGATGRGLCQHFNVPVRDVDIIVAAMGSSLASDGGFCCGQARVVDHQRLGGLGYCFSASLPPFLASAAMAALDELESNPQLMQQLQQNVRHFRNEVGSVRGLKLVSDELSPLLYFVLEKPTGSTDGDLRILQQVADELLDRDVLVSVSQRSPLEKCSLPIGIKVCVSAGHEKEDLTKAAQSFKVVAEELL